MQPALEPISLHCDFEALPFPDASIDLRGVAARAGAGAGPAPDAARGRARAGARGSRRDRRLQPGQPVGPAPARRPPAAGAWASAASRACTCRVPASSSATGGCATGCACWASRSRPAASAAGGRRSGPKQWLERLAWMDRLGDRWWPVLGAVYFVVAVKRVRGMRLVGLVRKREAQGASPPAVVANRRANAARERVRDETPAHRQPRWRPHGAEAAPMTEVVIYTDGACSGNPGPGGWGAWLQSGAHEKELFGGERADHQQPHGADRGDRGAGVAEAALQGHASTPTAQYVKNGITSWIHNWKARGWKTASQQAGEERRPLAAPGRTERGARRALALGQGPFRRPRQRTRRRAGQPRRRLGGGLTPVTDSAGCDPVAAAIAPGSLKSRVSRRRESSP